MDDRVKDLTSTAKGEGGEVEARLRTANRALRLLTRCNSAVVHATEELALLDELCRIAVESAGYGLAWVGEAVRDEERTVRLVTYAGPGEFLARVRVTWGDEPTGRGVLGTAIRDRHAAIASDMLNQPAFSPWREFAIKNNLGSALGVPLTIGSEIFGALAIYSNEIDAFSASEVELLEELGANISHGLTALRAQKARDEADRRAARLLDVLRRGQAIAEFGSWEFDLETNQVWGSEEAFRIYGLPLNAEQTVPYSELQRIALPEHQSIREQALRDLIAGVRPYVVDARIRRPSDGEIRHIHSRAELERDPDGKPKRILGVLQDITSRKQLEAELLHSQKMESIGRLAGGVAHDFNNLLTVIQSYAALILDEMGPRDRHRGDIEEIQKAATRAGELTHQLLAFSRKQVLKPQVLDLNDVVAGAERMLERIIGEDIELKTTKTLGLGPVLADRGQIVQVIMNLAVNARDAMEGGGKLTISTRAASLERGSDMLPGRYVVLSLSDTGSGMDAVTQSRIFEPFFTTKKDRGTGLGLSTVYGIVHQSGGHIRVHSELGRGTTFDVFLPVVESTQKSVDEVRTQDAGPSPQGDETILIVEDNEQVRTLLQSILSRVGYSVLCAPSAEEALRLVHGHPGPIHVLLTDIVMPGLSGPDLTERVLATHPQTKVIYMSGYPNGAVAQHGRRVNFLPKPLEPSTLLAKVREVLQAR